MADRSEDDESIFEGFEDTESLDSRERWDRDYENEWDHGPANDPEEMMNSEPNSAPPTFNQDGSQRAFESL
jgi:hypothetical protein